MLIFYDKSGGGKYIRPCPLINIATSPNTNSLGKVGVKYDITLTGSLLDDRGSPNNNQWGICEPISNTKGLQGILNKQRDLQNIFSNLLHIEVLPSTGTMPILKFYPTVLSVNFSEGPWVNKCDYTINLEAAFLVDHSDNIIGSEHHSSPFFRMTNGKPEDVISNIGGFIEDFQENWSIEPEEGNGHTKNPDSEENILRTYRLTRTLSAKGKYLGGYYEKNSLIELQPHIQAKNYLMKYMASYGGVSNNSDDYFNDRVATGSPSIAKIFASGLLDLKQDNYSAYNHSISETFDITQGSCTIQESWILADKNENSTENYSLSLSSSSNEPRNRVSIEGSIKGLTTIPASGNIFVRNHQPDQMNTPYENAINKYRTITNNGQFGLTAHVYKRAQAAAGGISLNHIPASLALSTNEFTGEINYTIEYDDRPLNLIPGVLYENISISDTYPGDAFAVIPVIGRPTGPVLQYIGGRTEYQRSFSLEIVVDKPSGVNHRTNYLQKPSLSGPTSTGIKDAIMAYSPAKDPGIRKYFVSPPQETWDPKEGRYTLNINWTYELNY